MVCIEWTGSSSSSSSGDVTAKQWLMARST